eukprot:CAMPEP_0170491268 /NCGR_PEP_ID=MMETSP0208-20121228/10699_1 /TAXON_ID=197538 /ORGANISM="Strombidium inclinatum, Strain S3" /LENGTH=108 /DNA_ID=CAMNT_0010766817 /DNA_START=67 /DNA_END=393 /DNA_ORIENTATION=+
MQIDLETYSVAPSVDLLERWSTGFYNQISDASSWIDYPKKESATPSVVDIDEAPTWKTAGKDSLKLSSDFKLHSQVEPEALLLKVVETPTAATENTQELPRDDEVTSE